MTRDSSCILIFHLALTADAININCVSSFFFCFFFFFPLHLKCPPKVSISSYGAPSETAARPFLLHTIHSWVCQMNIFDVRSGLASNPTHLLISQDVFRNSGCRPPTFSRNWAPIGPLDACRSWNTGPYPGPLFWCRSKLSPWTHNHGLPLT